MKFKCTFLGELTIIIKFKANNMNLFRLFFIYLVSVVILCQHQLLYFVIQIYLLIILAIQR